MSSRDFAPAEATPSKPNGGSLPVEDSILSNDTSRKPIIGLRSREADGVVGREMLADPVPVRRPVILIVDLVFSSLLVVGGMAIGSTKTGLNRNASQRISKYDTQFETIRSPAFGLQGSVRLSFPARLYR